MTSLLKLSPPGAVLLDPTPRCHSKPICTPFPAAQLSREKCVLTLFQDSTGALSPFRSQLLPNLPETVIVLPSVSSRTLPYQPSNTFKSAGLRKLSPALLFPPGTTLSLPSPSRPTFSIVLCIPIVFPSHLLFKLLWKLGVRSHHDPETRLESPGPSQLAKPRN